jgi:hypothetical protein
MSNKNNPVSIEEFNDAFRTDPSVTFYNLISKRDNFVSSKTAIAFWINWDAKKNEFIRNSNKEVQTFTKRINQLQFIVETEKRLKHKKSQLILTSNDYQISKKRFLVQAFCLKEFGYPLKDREVIEFKYSDILKAYKLATKDFPFSNNEQYEFSENSLKFVKDLIAIYIELVYIEKVFDYFVLGNFEFIERDYLKGDETIKIFALTKPKEQNISDNNFLSSKLKQKFKENYYQERANNDLLLSKSYTEKIQSDEDLLKESFFDINPNEVMPLYDFILMEKEGLKAYKKSITSIYFPQEEVDIEKISIQFENHEIPLLHIIYALGAISSYATQYYFATGPSNPGVFLNKDSLIQIFTHYQEWRDLKLNIKEQEHILKLIVRVNSKIPYSPLLEVQSDSFLLIPISFFENGGYERVFYDYVITDLLFSSNDKINAKAGLPAHQIRERAICEQLSKKVIDVFPNAISIANLQWPINNEFWGRKGEVDVVIYFPKEDILYLIEVKLNNTLSKNLNGKLRWLDESMYNGDSSASFQIQKDVNFFSNKLAHTFVLGKLGLDVNTEFNPTIIPLILTDVFWTDNTEITFNKFNDSKVLCISLFQFNLLLDGVTNIISGKEKVPHLNPGKWINDQLKSKQFWNGLPDKINDFLVIKSKELPGIIALDLR